MDSLFFIHIPKTAGTSFREAATRHWGQRKVLCDYGDSRHSSSAVVETVHQQRDYHAFKQHLESQNIRMLSGHAPVRYYRRIFKAENLLTFVREPVARVISHYQTACRYQGYAHSIDVFCSQSENINVQARYLEQMPPEMIGFIGITERYRESLKILNLQYDCKIQTLQLNRHKNRTNNDTDGPMKLASPVSEEQIAMIKHYNQEDISLYSVAQQLFDTRWNSLITATPYSHGKVQSLTAKRIEGWASVYGDKQAQPIEIVVNDNPVAIKTAQEYQPALKERNVSRDGFVGFVHAFEEPLSDRDIVIARHLKTGQILRGPTHPGKPGYSQTPNVLSSSPGVAKEASRSLLSNS